MAIVMNMTWAGVTEAQYEAVRKSIGFDVRPPKGGIFHVAALDANGLSVTDVWESAELFQAFAEQSLGPAAAAAGIPGQPDVQVRPVHFAFAPALMLGSPR